MTTLFLVSSALRASVVLFAGTAAVAGLSRASAAVRRSVLVLALGGSLAVPVIAAVAPSWRVEAPVLTVFAHESSLEAGGAIAGTPGGAEAHAGEAAGGRAPSLAPLLRVPVALWSLWLAGALLVTVRAWRSHRRAQALVARSGRVSGAAWTEVIARASAEAGAHADVRLCDAVDSPAVTGVLTPTVLLPMSAEEWPAERRRVVLVHELAHVRHRDGVAQVVADVACAWSWFNPLAWHCARRLRVERELAADDAVLGAGVRPSFYAEELLAHAGGEALGAFAMAERSSLGDRVLAILAADRPRAELGARGKALLCGSGVVVAVAAACTVPIAPAMASVDAAPTGADPAMQAIAEEEVASVLAAGSGESATVVVLDPATGAVLADAGRRGGHAFDVARSEAMSPGSTLKAVLLAAALETNAIQPTETFRCGPEPRLYPDGTLNDSSPGTEPRVLDVGHMLAVSSNIGFSRVFDALGGDRLGDWLGRFHFGQTLGLPGAASGVVPAAVTGSFRGAQIAIGEGTTATPLQVAAAYAALANDGVYHAPTVGGPAAPPERLVSSATARVVMDMLTQVVEDPHGTGNAAHVDGAHVAGKTGTAGWTSPDGRDHMYASFVGAADVRGRRIVALVGVETLRQDVWGGGTAAPVFAHLVSRLR